MQIHTLDSDELIDKLMIIHTQFHLKTNEYKDNLPQTNERYKSPKMWLNHDRTILHIVDIYEDSLHFESINIHNPPVLSLILACLGLSSCGVTSRRTNT